LTRKINYCYSLEFDEADLEYPVAITNQELAPR